MESEHIRVTAEEGRATAALRGEFDMAATFTVEPALERALEEPGVEALELDLSNLRFIDSTGIGVLLRLVSEADRRGIDLSMTPAPRDVQRVLEVTGVRDALPFTD